jgi:hypothetical protein
MNLDIIKVLSETIEHSSQVCKLFVASEIALNDGDAGLSLKNNKEAQQLFSTMQKDVFVEIKELLNVETDNVLDYDYPSVLELSKALADLSFNLSRYISMEIDNQGDNVKDILAEKIMTDINTVNEIFDALFNN